MPQELQVVVLGMEEEAAAVADDIHRHLPCFVGYTAAFSHVLVFYCSYCISQLPFRSLMLRVTSSIGNF